MGCQRPMRSIKQSGAVIVFSGVRSPRPAMLDCPTSKNERMPCAASWSPSLIHSAIIQNASCVFFYPSIAQKQPTFTYGCFYAENDEEGEKQNKKSGRASASPMLCDKPCIRSCTLRSSCGYRIAHFLVSRLYKSGILLEAGRHFQGGLANILQIYYCINRRMIRKRRFLLSQAVDRGR